VDRAECGISVVRMRSYCVLVIEYDIY
jgi:hypothetical protein